MIFLKIKSVISYKKICLLIDIKYDIFQSLLWIHEVPKEKITLGQMAIPYDDNNMNLLTLICLEGRKANFLILRYVLYAYYPLRYRLGYNHNVSEW